MHTGEDVATTATSEIVADEMTATLRCNANGHGANAKVPNSNQCLCVTRAQLRKIGIHAQIGDVVDLLVEVDGDWKHVRGPIHRNGLACFSGSGNRALSLKHGDRRRILAKRFVVPTNAQSRAIDQRDPFSVMGLHNDALSVEIKARFRDLMKQLHPDANNGETSDRLHKVVTAMNELRAKGKV
jgi:hypothetical protein